MPLRVTTDVYLRPNHRAIKIGARLPEM
jgi:hypothetical protein